MDKTKNKKEIIKEEKQENEKRVIAVLTAVLMTASLAGCGSGKLSNDYVTVNKYKGLEVTEVAKTRCPMIL